MEINSAQNDILEMIERFVVFEVDVEAVFDSHFHLHWDYLVGLLDLLVWEQHCEICLFDYIELSSHDHADKVTYSSGYAVEGLVLLLEVGELEFILFVFCQYARRFQLFRQRSELRAQILIRINFQNQLSATQIANQIALDTEVLKLLRIFELHLHAPAHIIILVVDGEFDLFLAGAYFVILLVLLRVEFDFYLYAASQPSKEGTDFLLHIILITIALYLPIIINSPTNQNTTHLVIQKSSLCFPSDIQIPPKKQNQSIFALRQMIANAGCFGFFSSIFETDLFIKRTQYAPYYYVNCYIIVIFGHILFTMLDQERKKASFSKTQLSYIIYGGKQQFQSYLQAQKVLDSDPVLKFDPSILHQSRHQIMEHMAQKLIKVHKDYNHLFPLDGTSQTIKYHLFCHSSPLSIHGIMFLNTLDNLCDEEQRKMFYEPALRAEILGCYAQTELGHGSDIQRLQTTATYNKQTQTFTINTPTTSAAKWWVGDLGVYCNHAAVFAQLIIDNKKYGLHTFLVPIRDPVTYKTLPGIEAGDIGPKQGLNAKDNGYAIFNNVVIPRRNILMKFHVVSKQGKYSLQGDQKISYATMLVTRSGIINIASYFYPTIVTIATRYSLLRKQFKTSKNQQITILDYQTQQAKVISRIGEVYALVFTARGINTLAKQVFQQAKKNSFERLNEAHILTSAAKAYLTAEFINNSQIARRSAGGHGFHAYNGMIGRQIESSPSITVQGQFTVLMLQVARFLFKSLIGLQKGKPLAPSVQYLENLKKGSLSIEINILNDLSSPQFVHQILTNFACISVQNMGMKILQGIEEGLTQKQVWNTYAGLTLVDAAIAHSIVTIHSFFIKECQEAKCPKVKAVLNKLCALYGLQKIIQKTSRVYETGILTPEGFRLISKRREQLLEELRPEALTLVEAFGYSDNVLMSAIAHSNERPYQNLINWARNHNTVNKPHERSQIIEAIKKAKSQLKPSL